jgi:hypothetical protein
MVSTARFASATAAASGSPRITGTIRKSYTVGKHGGM